MPVSPHAALDDLIAALSKLPGLGPRSARRAVLFLFKRREDVMRPLAAALAGAADAVGPCEICGNLDASNPCWICTDNQRDDSVLCVVEDVGDLWALERAGAFRGRYHVLGGVLSALDGAGPEDLAIASLIERARAPDVKEVVLALNATVDGAATAHYLTDRLEPLGVAVSTIARGVPVGGELDYLDDGTLAAALASRRPST